LCRCQQRERGEVVRRLGGCRRADIVEIGQAVPRLRSERVGTHASRAGTETFWSTQFAQICGCRQSVDRRAGEDRAATVQGAREIRDLRGKAVRKDRAGANHKRCPPSVGAEDPAELALPERSEDARARQPIVDVPLNRVAERVRPRLTASGEMWTSDAVRRVFTTVCRRLIEANSPASTRRPTSGRRGRIEGKVEKPIVPAISAASQNAETQPTNSPPASTQRRRRPCSSRNTGRS
jgi:hypothetical protein